MALPRGHREHVHSERAVGRLVQSNRHLPAFRFSRECVANRITECLERDTAYVDYLPSVIRVEWLMATLGEHHNEEAIVSQIVDPGVLFESTSLSSPSGLAYSVAGKELGVDRLWILVLGDEAAHIEVVTAGHVSDDLRHEPVDARCFVPIVRFIHAVSFAYCSTGKW